VESISVLKEMRETALENGYIEIKSWRRHGCMTDESEQHDLA
jgi:hypothetical protein